MKAGHRQRVAEDVHVVEAQGGDAAHHGAPHAVGRVQPPAQPHLHDRHVHALLQERAQSCTHTAVSMRCGVHSCRAFMWPGARYEASAVWQTRWRQPNAVSCSGVEYSHSQCECHAFGRKSTDEGEEAEVGGHAILSVRLVSESRVAPPEVLQEQLLADRLPVARGQDFCWVECWCADVLQDSLGVTEAAAGQALGTIRGKGHCCSPIKTDALPHIHKMWRCKEACAIASMS